MPSDTPLPDRCGAAVTDKVGLEIHASELTVDELTVFDEIGETLDVDYAFDFSRYEPFVSDDVTGRRSSTEKRVEDYDYHIDDSVIETIVLAREGDPAPVECDPEFDEAMQYMRSGFDLISLELVRSVADKEGEADRVECHLAVADADPYVRNRTTEVQGYCLRYPMDCGRCYVHGGATNGPGEGNTNAMTHGLHAKRTNFYKTRSEEDKAFIEAMVDSWLESAPFDRNDAAKVNELYRVAIDQLRLWHAVDEYVDEDGEVARLAYEQVVGQDEMGAPIEAEQANPINLEYSRLDGDTLKKLEKLGCLDDPESQKADAQMSLAQKLSGLDDE